MRTKRRMKKGGDCGCNKLSGGGALGAPSFQTFDNKYTYPQNSFQNDPIAPSAQDATRMNPNTFPSWNLSFSGGKRKKSKKTKKTKKTRKTNKRKIKGGNQYMDSQLAGITYSSGTIAGAPIGANIITGNYSDIMNGEVNLLNPKPFI